VAFTITHRAGELADDEPRQLADDEPRQLADDEPRQLDDDEPRQLDDDEPRQLDDDEPRHLAGVSRAEAVRIMTLLATGGDVESLEWLPGYR
jgi:hypothetical protein